VKTYRCSLFRLFITVRRYEKELLLNPEIWNLRETVKSLREKEKERLNALAFEIPSSL